MKLIKGIGLAATLITLVLVACGGDDNSEGTESATATVTGTPRPTAPLILPADFPEHFALHPAMSYDQGARFENQVLAAFTAAADSAGLATFYREQLTTEPWELVSESANAEGTVITINFRDVDAEIRGILTLSSPEAAGGTSINLRFTVPVMADPLPSPDNPLPFETTSDDGAEPEETD